MTDTSSSPSPHVPGKRKKAVYGKEYVRQYEINRQRVLAEQREYFEQNRAKQVKSRKEHQREKRNAYQRERRRLKKLQETQKQGQMPLASHATTTSSTEYMTTNPPKQPLELNISFLLNP
ncbi:hypothetical protein AC1031_001845 [Aphanomyces cochlioides]|nr:hypothetical protein AC1031_001845 [Aphanomyces cochlioides]